MVKLVTSWGRFDRPGNLWVVDQKTRHAVALAVEAADHAEKTRKGLRRRTKVGDERREKDLAAEIDRLHKAMAPIRRAIGRLPYQPAGKRDDKALRHASKRLKYERKQIRKMQSL